MIFLTVSLLVYALSSWFSISVIIKNTAKSPKFFGRFFAFRQNYGTFLRFSKKTYFFSKYFGFSLDFSPITSIIVIVVKRKRQKQQNTAELCKGSTTDSDSVCEGSNPSSATIFEPLKSLISAVFLWFFELYLDIVQFLGNRTRPAKTHSILAILSKSDNL